ncbi:MAG: diguanylate cyclase [Limnochordaceae bacterium]|nr:diguanylate cyclase [Limnochordaceae bacterium]
MLAGARPHRTRREHWRALAGEATAVLALFLVAAQGRPAPLVVAAGYALAGLLAWAGIRTRNAAWEWGAAAASLAGILGGARLVPASFAPEAAALGLMLWGVTWGLRLSPARPWGPVLGAWMLLGLEAWLGAGNGTAVAHYRGLHLGLWTGAAVLQAWLAGRLASRTEAQSRQRARHLATLHEITRAMARPMQLEPLFETIHREVSRVMSADAFIIALYEAEHQLLHAAFIYDKGMRYPAQRYPADEGPTAEVVRTGKPLFLNRGPEEMARPVPGKRIIGAPEEPLSVIIVPMTLEGKVLGTISAQSYRPRAYTTEDFELLATIAGQAAVYVQNARLYERTAELALTDPMTGLGNARMLQQTLEQELARCRRSGRPLSLIMFDSDDLKQVNDRYGHLVGDRFLNLLADIIRTRVRAGDVVTRYAGDEFVVILPEARMDEATRVAERIVSAVASTPLVTESGEKVYTTISAGVASYPECAETGTDLMWSVDRALYASKQAGKGRITCSKPRGAPPPVKTSDQPPPSA